MNWPWLTFVALLFGGGLLYVSIVNWRRIHWSRNLARISIGILILYSTLGRLLIFQSGIQVAPTWWPRVADMLLIAVAISALISGALNKKA